jgi:amino acid transporter
MTGVRLTWAMSRDHRFPGWQLLEPISPRTGTPRNATFFFLIVAEVILAVFAERTGVLFKLFSAATLLPAILYLATVILFAVKRRSLPASQGFDLKRWETPVVVLALVWLLFEMSVFRDSSFKDPWIYIGVMAAIGLVYLAYLLVRQGPRGLDMPAMDSIDAEAAGQAEIGGLA